MIKLVLNEHGTWILKLLKKIPIEKREQSVKKVSG